LVVNDGIEVFDLTVVKPPRYGAPWIGVHWRLASEFTG
jgi:hypothetical protein